MTYTRSRFTAGNPEEGDFSGQQRDWLRKEHQRIEAGIPRPTVINVRDFGWRGNGATDDYPAIQGAINAANANGSASGLTRVTLPPGTSVVTSPVTVKSNVWLDGCGRLSVLKGVFGSSTNRILTSSDTVQQSNIVLSNFTVDRTGTNAEHGIILGGIVNLLLENLYVVGPASPSVTAGAIGISPFDSFADIESKNVCVRRCVVEKSNNFGIAFGYVTNGIIDHCHLFDCYREGIGIEGYDASPGVAPEKGNLNIVVANNTIILTENSNHFGGSVGPGMLIGGSTSGGYVRNCSVTGNTIVGTETVASQAYDGITVLGGTVLGCEDVVIANNTLKNLNGRGIDVGAAGSITRRIKVADNTITDCNQGANASPSGAAIELRNATSCAVNGNHVKGSLHTHIVEETSTSDGNAIHGNTGDTGTTAGYTIVGASSYVSHPSAFLATNDGGVLRHETFTLADDATQAFAARGTNNRALYLLTTNFGGTGASVAFFTADGTNAPTMIYGGASVVSGAANPDTDGAVNIWPSSSSVISIKNRLGSSRVFTLMSIATQ